MATVAYIVRRALLKLDNIDANEAVDDSDSEDAIGALNDMMARWEANGLAMGWTPVVNPSDTMPTPDYLNGAIYYNLAIELAPDYGVSASNEVVNRAGMYMSDLMRDRYCEAPLYTVTCTPLPTGFGTGVFYNIDSDSPKMGW
jgi:hypothetical protein